jgi:collagenase-like PrtC family protease
MAYIITAHRIDSSEIVASITLGHYTPATVEFLRLMGVSKTIIRKVFTPEELKQARKNSVNFMSAITTRRKVKQFLSSCIDAAGDSNIDIWFA